MHILDPLIKFTEKKQALQWASEVEALYTASNPAYSQPGEVYGCASYVRIA
jgi:hypothetical protein